LFNNIPVNKLSYEQTDSSYCISYPLEMNLPCYTDAANRYEINSRSCPDCRRITTLLMCQNQLAWRNI